MVKMSKYFLIFLAVIAAWCFVFPFKSAGLCSPDQNLTKNAPQEKGWATLSGILAWIKPDYSSATQEKQLVLVDAGKDMTILIGEQVNNLLNQEGKEVVLTGVYKPAMMIKGKITAVLEVRFIDRIKEEDKKNEK